MKKTLALVLALCMLLSCGIAIAEEPAPTYTYNGQTATFPTNWNPHQYKTATDNDLVLNWIADGFYDFDYNENEDGYVMEPRMVVGEPVDVSADYVGEEWGIPEGAAGRAWKYTLRDDLKWQDGTPITAADYVFSAKEQLNPLAQNYRADSLYSGSVVLHNAEPYVKQGVESDISLANYISAIGAADLAAALADNGAVIGEINWKGSFGDTYDFETKTWTGAAEDAIVATPLTLAELYTFYTEGEGAKYATWADADTLKGWALDELFVKYTYPEMDFEKVGIKAVSPTEIVFILDKALQGFQLKYNLGLTLVKEDLYTACASITDGVYTNNYNTSVETTASYGPYMLTSFQSDKEIVLEKNPNWYGYGIEENEGCYQTTHLNYQFVAEASTGFEMFLNGKLDQVGLDVDHIAEYITSDYTYYDEGASVFAMAVNPALDALTANQAAAGENINKTILTLKNFRMALSLGIDRAAFIAATSPSNSPAFALYGNTIVGNPETGTFYRDSEEAKQVIVDFWGLTDEIGEGKLYATKEEAIESISGYNLEMARDYFNKAYDEAIATGLMDEDDVVQIIIGLPNTRPFYANGYEYIVNNYTEAVVGTKLEGKLTFVQDATIGNAFGDALRTNKVDMLFGVGWTGSTFDPYNLMQVYVYTNYQYDRAWDATTATIDIELNGKTYTSNAKDWWEIINGAEKEVIVTGTEEKATLCMPYTFDEVEAANRLRVLAALENIVLQNYNFIPLMNDASALLKGMQINFHTEEQVFPMSYGGVKYYTYNYSDAEWDAFVAEQGGTLNYK